MALTKNPLASHKGHVTTALDKSKAATQALITLDPNDAVPAMQDAKKALSAASGALTKAIKAYEKARE